MTGSNALRTVLVAGGGITGWCAAAALKRHAPFLDVTILTTPLDPDTVTDRVACALPSLIGFHDDLGIGEADGVARTGAGYRLGTQFSGWAGDLPDYVHAYGRYGRPLGPTSFYLHWVRAAKRGAAVPYDAYAPAAALARAGRFAPAAAGTILDGHEYGLTLDLPRYLTMMRAFALHVGVRDRSGEIGHIRCGATGLVEGVTLAGGETLTADLFVDATGPGARLRTALDDRCEDWSAWIPCDRVLLTDHADDPQVLTRVTAQPAGWSWTSGLQTGLAYASALLSDAKAARAMRNRTGVEPGDPIRLSPRTRPEPWRGNVVAIGDAATVVEPLEWCNLHLALSAIDRLVAMLPGREPTSIEAADFNRQTLAEANRVRDFLAMHWRIARRSDPLWRAVAEAVPPGSLAHTLTQWTERGRLPQYEEETFVRDSWAAVLIGQGCLPRRIDPLVEAFPAAQASAAMASLAASIAGMIPHVPTHAAYRAEQTNRLSA